MATYVYAPTVTPADGFSPEADAQALRSAMKGFGTDEATIIGILSKRASFQRAQIDAKYKTLFGRDLIDDLKSELGGKFEDAVLALMTPIVDLLAEHAKKALSGLGTDEDDLIEIIAPLTNREIRELKAAYQRLYDTPLEEALVNETSGDFKRLLVATLQAQRDEFREVDERKAVNDAQALVSAGEKKWGTEESVFISILANRSFPQLYSTFVAYEQLAGRSIEQALEAELSGDLLMGLSSLVKLSKNTSAFFAERLHKAMKGMGTDDRTLLRIIVTRSECDLRLVKEEFERTYGQPLEDFISSETSGDYKRILLALLEG